MCGIVGYVGPRKARALLLAGLEKLEYRGYDSAGISVLDGDRVDAVRAVGNLAHLREAIAHREAATAAWVPATATALAEPPRDQTGIGHTRWATHGRVTEENAHPHYDTTDSVHIVVNGIVENYIALKARLQKEAHPPAVFTSETDAEVIAHLVAHHYDGDLLTAVRAAYAELRGHYAFVAMTAHEPGLLVGARKECPLIVGRGDGETFIGSAIPAFLRETRRVQYMEDDEIVVLRADGAEFFTPDGEPVPREIVEIDWDADTAEKQGHETFMLKEIHEQPSAVAETIGERAARGWGIDLGELTPPTQRPAVPIDDELLRRVRRVVIVGCGTAYHAGLIGRYAIEHWARVPVEVDIASEYRYRDPVVGPDDLVIGISQSGETADTLAAMRTARAAGAAVLAVTNVMGAQATREADGVLYTRAGLEIGVAATKTFVSQITVMYLIALRLAELRGVMDRTELKPPISELKRLPHRIAELLERDIDGIEAIARAHYGAEFFLYLGRHVGLPIALEGALKLKEISYIATDAYPAGEMKHGP
ncbi:MAG TPA: glutamine--fructose-6-phosphate transaminase (isomerizing), partial [Solirubrobacteraceae bacterium]|nr:glutamine--fructose-6-phosphate transaminase (isomerizing) [Solirubrobacteraceae bacterium]